MKVSDQDQIAEFLQNIPATVSRRDQMTAVGKASG